MTAEIIIMNREAVALAADSASTIKGARGQKIFTSPSINKIFALSQYSPVGIMVYGTANFMKVPWEIIIKIYRSKLKNKKFNTLKEYSDDFLDFLNQHTNLFPESEQKIYFERYISSYFLLITASIKNKIKQLITKNKNLTTKEIEDIILKEIEDIISKILKEYNRKLKEAETIPNLPKNHNEQCKKNYGKIIEKAKKDIFEKLPMTQSLSKLLIEIGLNVFSKMPKLVSPYSSGVVITGFGEKDLFPSFQSFFIEGIINNILHYGKYGEININFEVGSSIVPLAQKEMVFNFMEGVNPIYEKEINKIFSQIFDEYPKIIIESINKLKNEEKTELKEKLKAMSNEWKEKNIKRRKEYRRKKFVNPVINTVTMLPKDELAAMAESLVSLTSLKKSVTIEAPTVAGPIDVAIISKGDGFIWIKRKYYFKAELNPRFFEKYKKEVKSDKRVQKK